MQISTRAPTSSVPTSFVTPICMRGTCRGASRATNGGVLYYERHHIVTNIGPLGLRADERDETDSMGFNGNRPALPDRSWAHIVALTHAARRGDSRGGLGLCVRVCV